MIILCITFLQIWGYIKILDNKMLLFYFSLFFFLNLFCIIIFVFFLQTKHFIGIFFLDTEPFHWYGTYFQNTVCVVRTYTDRNDDIFKGENNIMTLPTPYIRTLSVCDTKSIISKKIWMFSLKKAAAP